MVWMAAESVFEHLFTPIADMHFYVTVCHLDALVSNIYTYMMYMLEAVRLGSLVV
jgi:hypothetical protein